MCLTPLSTIFHVYRGVNFIGRGIRSTRKTGLLRVTSFITCIEYTSPWTGFERYDEFVSDSFHTNRGLHFSEELYLAARNYVLFLLIPFKFGAKDTTIQIHNWSLDQTACMMSCIRRIQNNAMFYSLRFLRGVSRIYIHTLFICNCFNNSRFCGHNHMFILKIKHDIKWETKYPIEKLFQSYMK